MAIQDAIAALSPSVWFRMDEISGTLATNSGSRLITGTYSGSYELGVPGPEIDTFATRLYAGGQMVSQQMDLSTFVDQSLGLWMSTDASGAINTNYPVVNIGDPANRLTRGPTVFENHGTIGTPQASARYGSAGPALIPLPQPIRFWHWVVCTFTSGTGGIKLYIDGVLQPAANLTTPGALTLTDPMLVRCDEPVVVAHVCWWGGVLTQTQIQSVSAALATWPYDLPINTPPPTSGGGGGGLTEGQAEQLNAIEGYTDDIPGLTTAATYTADKVNVIEGKVDQLLDLWAGFTGTTLPSLNDRLNDLVAAVTAQIQGPTGPVDQTVGQLASSNPMDFLTQENLSGGPTCERIEVDLSLSKVLGVVLRLTDYPPDLQWKTPDHGWSVKDLAVIRVTRGGNLILRHGVHETQHTINPLPELLTTLPVFVPVPNAPPDYQVSVDFGEGVCGELIGLFMP